MLIANTYKVSHKLNLSDNILSPLTSRVLNIREWELDSFKKFSTQLMGKDNYPKHRKLWEFVSMLRAMEELNVLNESSIGLSIAAGTERILYFLANTTGGIVASDIYGEGDFSQLEASKNFLTDQDSFAPFPYNKENLCAAYANALSLPFECESFDYAFSMSAIEHFGGISNTSRAISEAVRVLRPGGVLVLTTDLSINNFTYDQSFSIKQIKKLMKRSDAELIGEFCFETSPETLMSLCDMRKDNLKALPHINLKALASIFTSCILVLRKKGDYQIDSAEELDKRKKSIWTKSFETISTYKKSDSPNRFQYWKEKFKIYYIKATNAMNLGLFYVSEHL